MPQRPAARAPSGSPRFVAQTGQQPGRHQRPTVRHGDPLGSAPITIGRAPDSTLVIDDEYASARHARLFQHEGQWVAEDLGSTNGTWISKTG